MNADDGEATFRRNAFRGRFDAGEHRVGTVRIGFDFNRILIVHNVEPRTRREARQSVLLLFEPQSALAFLCVEFHWFIAHSGCGPLVVKIEMTLNYRNKKCELK